MADAPIDILRQLMGYQFPRLGPLGFKLFNRIYRGRKINSRFFHNLRVPIDFSDVIQTAAYWRGSRYESPTPQLINKMISEYSLTHFFDIGANFGFFSYYIKSVNPTTNVYSFEPGPDNFNKMMEVKAQNGLNGFEPQNIGLGDTNGNLTFHLTIGDSGHSTFGENPLYAGNRSMMKELIVPVKRFDDWREENNISIALRSAWIAKIDVEGFELKVLQGMSESLRSKSFKALCIEINTHTINFFNIKSKEIFDLLASYGYQAFDEDMKLTQPMVPPEMRNVFFILKY